VVLALVFVATRLPAAWLADHPEHYGPPDTKVTGDPEFYEAWASALVDEGRPAYTEVAVEYPPGALPFIVAPEVGRDGDDSYRSRFVVVMVLVDLAGLLGLWLLARRTGRQAGCWLWLWALPALGPITYVRLDLVPAVATIWALYGTALGASFAAGGSLAFAILAKLYPGFFLPLLFAAARRKVAWAAGAAIVLALGLGPFLIRLGALAADVLGYHLERGIQVESTWGAALLGASKLGYPIEVAYNFGAFHVASSSSRVLETTSTVLSLVVLIIGSVLLIARKVERAPGGPAAGCFALLALLMVTGSVFSPQFLIWLAAPGAVALSFKRSAAAPWAYALLPAALISQALYPFLYNPLLVASGAPLGLLAARNLLVLAAGVGALGAQLRATSATTGSPRRGATR
jgi:Glycosyltransferase family 87